MSKGILFIDELTAFSERVQTLLSSENDLQILVSGTFDNQVYKEVLDKVLGSKNIKNCKIIIPYVTNSGVISRSYINKIYNSGGQIRINSKFRSSLIVIGEYAYVLSFSSKYNREYGIKTHFECCIETNDFRTLERIRTNFMGMWTESLPVINE